MTKEELYNLHYAICQDARHLMDRKNADYAEGSDPFKNFRGSQQYGVHPAKGILIRIGDKLQRFDSFINRGDLKVTDESLRDSAIDVINYVVLMYGLLTENNSNDLKMIYDTYVYNPETGETKVVTFHGVEIKTDPYIPEGMLYEERKNQNDTTWNKEVDEVPCTCGSTGAHDMDCAKLALNRRA